MKTIRKVLSIPPQGTSRPKSQFQPVNEEKKPTTVSSKAAVVKSLATNKSVLRVTECLSPDLTFAAKELRAIIQGTYRINADEDDAKKEPYAFTPEEAELLVKDKMKKRNLDGRIVVGNFTGLISKLNRERMEKKGPFPRRIQVGYIRGDKDEDNEPFNHWTSVDILLTETQLKVFYLDDAGDEKNLQSLKRAVVLQPGAELTICEDVEVDGKSLAIQKDGESCSVFMVDNMFQMSKLPDLHDQVDQHRVQDPDYKNIFTLDPRRLPPVLVRNAQSNGFIESWKQFNKDRLNEPVNSKKQNLPDYVKSHSVFYPPCKRTMNAGIQHKQIKYAARLRKLKGV